MITDQGGVSDLGINSISQLGISVETLRICRGGAQSSVHTMFPRHRKARRRSDRIILYLPGRWQNARSWAKDNCLRDLRVRLTTAGLTVASVAYRTSHCADVRDIGGWRTKDFLADIVSIAKLVARTFDPSEAWICGFSMGAAFALLSAPLIESLPVRGLILLDGSPKAPVRTASFDLDQALKNVKDKADLNPFADQRFRRVAARIINSDRCSEPMLGVAPQSFKSLDKDQLRFLLAGDPWWPCGQVTEMKAISDYDKHPTLAFDDLAAVNCSILGIASDGNKSGDRTRRLLAAASLTGARTVEIRTLSTFHHLDILSNGEAVEWSAGTILDWISRK